MILKVELDIYEGIELLAYSNKNHKTTEQIIKESLIICGIIGSDDFDGVYNNDIVTEIVFKCVSDAFGISIEDIKGGGQRREICDARHCARSKMCKHTSYSLHAIGEKTGNADHTTVIHSRKTWSDIIETEKKYLVLDEMIDLRIEKFISEMIQRELQPV